MAWRNAVASLARCKCAELGIHQTGARSAHRDSALVQGLVRAAVLHELPRHLYDAHGRPLALARLLQAVWRYTLYGSWLARSPPQQCCLFFTACRLELPMLSATCKWAPTQPCLLPASSKIHDMEEWASAAHPPHSVFGALLHSPPLNTDGCPACRALGTTSCSAGLRPAKLQALRSRMPFRVITQGGAAL